MGTGRETREKIAAHEGRDTTERGASAARGGARGRGLIALVACLLVPGALSGQGTPIASPPKCESGTPIGSLGITGISCERCQFYTNGRVHRAVFWTEPTITHLNPAMAAASVLKDGDVLVAVDGRLITTREGSERFSALPPLGNVELRVRRDGQVRDLSVPVTAVCPTAKTALPEVAGRPLPAPAPPEVVVGPTAPDSSLVPPPAPPKGARERTVAVVAPAPRTAPVTPTFPTPAVVASPPPPDRMLPAAELGFAFTCSRCTYHAEDGFWTFESPPVVSGVTTTVGIGSSSGLRDGDRILEVNGASITTPDGARQLADLEPGDRPRWTVERDGRRMTVTTVARKRANTVVAKEGLVAADLSRAPVRYTGMVGNAAVEVRGGKVSVVEVGRGSMLIIRTQDAEIRIRVPGSDDERLEVPPPPSKRKPKSDR